MDFPCSECAYVSKCFPVLKWFFHHQCQQGRRTKKPQAQLSDFKGDGKGEYDTKFTP